MTNKCQKQGKEVCMGYEAAEWAVVLKFTYKLAFDTDFDISNSSPLKMRCFLKAYEQHL